MQETINFEIGGQTYKLVGNNKELTEMAAMMVNDKFNSIRSMSQSASNREIALMLTALNLAEEKVTLMRRNQTDEDALLSEVESMAEYVRTEIDKLIIQ